MPELPEVEALVTLLDRTMSGQRIERCDLASFSALKTVVPPLDDLVGRQVVGCRRRGKFIGIELDGRWLVIHLARGGWIRWYDDLPPVRVRPSRGPIALRVGLANGAGFDAVEAGTEKRLAFWVLGSPDEIEAVATLGIDPLDARFTVDELARRLHGLPATLKTALTTQSLVAGVGNAYSDEALHAARLSPYKKAANLDAAEVARLHDALVSILAREVERSSELGPAELKRAKRRAMQVHGRTGKACPVCEDTIRQVVFATKSMQYCPTCQTGGKPLADRRLSRLLR